jgi:hypothetical protein
LVAQGTVQVKQDERGQITIVINPVCDYKVRHKGKSYTVFVSDDNDVNYLMLPTEQSFEVNESMRGALVQSAVGQVKIAVELAATGKTPKVEATGQTYKITGVRVPAPPVSR